MSPYPHYFTPVNSSYLSCIILCIIFPSSLRVSPCIVVGVSWCGLFSWCFLHHPSSVDIPVIYGVEVQWRYQCRDSPVIFHVKLLFWFFIDYLLALVRKFSLIFFLQRSFVFFQLTTVVLALYITTGPVTALYSLLLVAVDIFLVFSTLIELK